jgi:predicted N-acetyltransferase YhbS
MPTSRLPVPSLHIVDENRVGPELDAAVRLLLCDCFPADAETFAARRAWNDVLPLFSVLAWQDEIPVGQVSIVDRSITCSGEAVRVAGVQSLAVAPALRGSGLSQRLMNAAMQEARRREIPFGLLFCLPGLENFYARLGWLRTDRIITMLDAAGSTVPLTAKNICMELPLGEEQFPLGPIDLGGRDW